MSPVSGTLLVKDVEQVLKVLRGHACKDRAELNRTRTFVEKSSSTSKGDQLVNLFVVQLIRS